MGWGEPAQAPSVVALRTEALVEALEDWRGCRSTLNEERLLAALDDYRAVCPRPRYATLTSTAAIRAVRGH